MCLVVVSGLVITNDHLIVEEGELLACFSLVYNASANLSACSLLTLPLRVIGRLYSVIVAIPGHLSFNITTILCV